MPFNEAALLAGLKILSPPFNTIVSVGALHEALKYDPPQYASEERIVNRSIALAVTNLNRPPSETSHVRASVGEPQEYWQDLWLSLFFGADQLKQFESNAGTPVGEVARLFNFLRSGLDVVPAMKLTFIDRANTKRAPTVSHITGWTELRPDRGITIAEAVQVATKPADFRTFDAFYSPLPAGIPKQEAIREKKKLLNECLDLEDTYWNALQ